MRDETLDQLQGLAIGARQRQNVSLREHRPGRQQESRDRGHAGGGIDRLANAAVLEFIEGGAADAQIRALIIVTECEGTARGTGRCRPRRLRCLPVLQFVLCAERCSELELCPDGLIDRSGTRQALRTPQAVVQQFDFPVLAFQIGLDGLHATLAAAFEKARRPSTSGMRRRSKTLARMPLRLERMFGSEIPRSKTMNREKSRQKITAAWNGIAIPNVVAAKSSGADQPARSALKGPVLVPPEHGAFS